MRPGWGESWGRSPPRRAAPSACCTRSWPRPTQSSRCVYVCAPLAGAVTLCLLSWACCLGRTLGMLGCLATWLGFPVGEPLPCLQSRNLTRFLPPRNLAQLAVAQPHLPLPPLPSQALHSRMEPLLYFFVDAASSIDAEDPGWHLLTAVEQGQDGTEVLGFATYCEWGYTRAMGAASTGAVPPWRGARRPPWLGQACIRIPLAAP